MTRTVLFITANESKGGERDYMMAIAAELQERAREDVQFRACTLPQNDIDAVANSSDIGGDATRLPVTKQDFAHTPVLSDSLVDSLDGEIEIVAVGRSTLQAGLGVEGRLSDRGIDAPVHYITHLIDKIDYPTLDFHDVHVFAPLTREQLDKPSIMLTPLDAVPHTNTPALCKAEWDKFKETPNGRKLNKWVENSARFVCVVPNAGIGVEKVHTPCKAQDAYEQGLALGKYPRTKGMNLFVADSGPRAKKDRSNVQQHCFGELAMDDPSVNTPDNESCIEDTNTAFAAGYMAGQYERGGKPEVICDRFRPGGVDSVKASLYIASSPACFGFIVNNEGYGTMEGAVVNLDDATHMVGMFRAEPSLSVPDRVANMDKYGMLGIGFIEIDDAKQLYISRLINASGMPNPNRNAAAVIVKELGLLQENPISPTAPVPSGS